MQLETWAVKEEDGSVFVTDDEEDARRRARAHGTEAEHRMEEILPAGTRIRDVRRPEFTGRIKAHEWQRPGVLSLIPYNVAWDDSEAAREAFGMFWIYATPGSVEEVEA